MTENRYDIPVDAFVSLDSDGGLADQCFETLQVDDYELTRYLGIDFSGTDSLAKLERILGLISHKSDIQKLNILFVFTSFAPDKSAATQQIMVNFLRHALDGCPNVRLAVFSASPIPKTAGVIAFHVPCENEDEFNKKTARHLEKIIGAQRPGTRLRQKSGIFSSDIKEFDPHADKPIPIGDYVLRLNLEMVPYEMYCSIKKGQKNLFVFCQDAINRSRTVLPHFFRWSWAKDLPGSLIVVNDPTLYLAENLNAGWMLGTRSRDYAAELAEIIQNIADNMAVERLYFFGASAGGFSAMAMASCLPGAEAIVDIPQVNLEKYHVRREVDAVVLAALGFDSVEGIPPEYRHRIDVIERFRRNRRVPNILYLQNMLDATHVESQFGYFFSAIAKIRRGEIEHFGDINVETYRRWHMTKGGHFPLAKHQLLTRLRAFVERSKRRSWSDDIFPELQSAN